jgi:hypothetical protein
LTTSLCEFIAGSLVERIGAQPALAIERAVNDAIRVGRRTDVMMLLLEHAESSFQR